MSRKVFDQPTYQYGREGERTFRQYMIESGMLPKEKPAGVYGPDYQFGEEGDRVFAEVERMRRGRWAVGDEPFRFPTLNQLADRAIGPNVVHAQLSADQTKAFVSFYCDHLVAPVFVETNMNNVDERIRKLPVDRALLVDLRSPANTSFAEMNRRRVRALVTNAQSKRELFRAGMALVGDIDSEYGPPYGMPSDEWLNLRQMIESATGVLNEMKDRYRDPSRPSSRPVQKSLF